MRLDEFAAGLAPDVKLVVGNNPAMNGRDAAKQGIGYFFSTIAGLKHHMVNVADSNGLTFLEANVEYLRKDGRSVTIPTGCPESSASTTEPTLRSRISSATFRAGVAGAAVTTCSVMISRSSTVNRYHFPAAPGKSESKRCVESAPWPR